MDHMTHQADGHAADQHAGHKMPEAHGSHDRHAGHSVAMFRDKFWWSFALTIPVVFWSTDVQHWLGYRAPTFPGSNLITHLLQREEKQGRDFSLWRMQEQAGDEWLAAEDQEYAPGDHEHRKETQHDPQPAIRWLGHKVPFPIGTDYTSEPTRLNPPEPGPTI
jgi:hypothetical protein